MIKNYLPTEPVNQRWWTNPQTDEQWNGNEPYHIDEECGGKMFIKKKDESGNPIEYYPIERYEFNFGTLRYIRELDYIVVGTLYLKDSVRVWIADCLDEQQCANISRITSNSVWIYDTRENKVKTKSALNPDVRDQNKDDYEKIKYILSTKFENNFAANKIIEKVKELYNNNK